MEELISAIIRATFGVEAKDRARESQKSYSDFYDVVPYPPNYKIPEFTKFSSEDSRTTYEHVDQFLAQCGRASSMNTCKLRLFSLSLSGTALIWFTSLSANSIDTWAQLEQKFHAPPPY
jgi:Retrotransposon gag protein.